MSSIRLNVYHGLDWMFNLDQPRSDMRTAVVSTKRQMVQKINEQTVPNSCLTISHR